MFSILNKNINEILDFEDFKEELKEFKRSKLIDVSTTEEFDHLHIPGSININFLTKDFELRLDQLDKTKAYFLYCRDGSKCTIAAKVMADKGFKKVFSLNGGITSWKGTLARSF